MKDSQDELEKYLSAGKPAPKNFGEAFNQARDRKQNTFYYKGKLYTTELAGSKNPASSPSPSPSPSSSPSPSPAPSKTSTQAERATKYKEDIEEKQRATSEAIRKGEEERDRLLKLEKIQALEPVPVETMLTPLGILRSLGTGATSKAMSGLARGARKGEPSFKSGFPMPKYKKEPSFKSRPSDDELDIIRLGSDFAAKKGGKVKSTYKQGGKVPSASKRADGAALRGKTRGKIY